MDVIDFEALKFIVKENEEKNVVLTFHSMGDTDAVSSAIAVAACFKNAKIIMPDFITTNATRILRRLGFDMKSISNDFDESADLIVMLDVNNFEDCGPFRYKLESFKNEILILDHHTPKEIAKQNVMVFNDEHYNSASSIVYDLLDALSVEIDKNIAEILLSGIISDSANLVNTTSKTFMQIGKLLETAQTDYTTLLDKMGHVAEPNARAKTITDLKESRVEVIDDLLFVYGKAHSHANLAADSAVRIGADVALFYAENEKEISFSSRLRSPLDKKLGIHLGVIMRAIAKSINGTGGGHPCAGGAYGPLGSDPKQFERLFISEITKRISR
ncbi:MAG: bifunctional oligoribonuclease/PAP phosphatase NrnA [Candidatus Micrarchaeales archaeon]